MYALFRTHATVYFPRCRTHEKQLLSPGGNLNRRNHRASHTIQPIKISNFLNFNNIFLIKKIGDTTGVGLPDHCLRICLTESRKNY